MTKATEDVKKKLESPRRKRSISMRDCLSTGSTLLNLACTGRPDVGFPMGHYVYFVGDTDSGKTFFCLTCLAEAVRNKRFKDHRFVYDGGEFGALMDMEKFFGKAVMERLEPPYYSIIDDVKILRYSETIEEFYFNLQENLKQGPCIYILDSMDSLSSTYEGKKFDEKEKAFRGGAEAKGDYGDGKAKVNSSMMRRMLPLLQSTGSILIVINQTRDNPAAGMFESKKTHSGGKALSFYASIKLLSSVKGSIVKQVNKKKRKIGTHVRIEVKRSRVTGKQREVIVPIYPSVGIDDLGSCVDFLVAEGRWKKNSSGLINTGGDFVGTGEDVGTGGGAISARANELVQYVEENELERTLRRLVGKVWNEIEDACSVERKPRY